MFEKALKAEYVFQDYETEHLSMIGNFIGRHPVFFRKIYKAYRANEQSVSYEPDIGAPVTVMFSQEGKVITVKRLKIEVTFQVQQFFKFLELIDVCFLPIIPIGSVVDIDLDMMSDTLKERIGDINQGAFVMIIAQKIALRETLEGFYADYLAVLWPFGLQERMTPFLISNMMIRNIVHKGMTNGVEEEFKARLKSKAVSDTLRSLTYITEDDTKNLRVNFDTERKNLKSGG